MDFDSYEDVDLWLETPGNSIDKLREHLAAGRMSEREARWAHNWLRRHDDGISRELAERAANAAERSARAAERSVWAAGIAVGVSLVALGVAAGAALKP